MEGDRSRLASLGPKVLTKSGGFSDYLCSLCLHLAGSTRIVQTVVLSTHPAHDGRAPA
jgi:hypothetical protein